MLMKKKNRQKIENAKFCKTKQKTVWWKMGINLLDGFWENSFYGRRMNDGRRMKQ